MGPSLGLAGKGPGAMNTEAQTEAASDATAPDACTDEAMANAELVALRDCVRVVGREDTGEAAPTVRAWVRTGEELAVSVDMSTPAVDLADRWRRLAAKFARLVEPVLANARVDGLLALVGEIEQLACVSELAESSSPVHRHR